ncbi:phage tail tape measure protein [Undibacterium sp. Ren11W]|uniref:phage tail tape measure protein n=1 Tax=Undibacterium sp. Ren11W TaxID=3413045 RepID=UPI003BF10CF4
MSANLELAMVLRWRGNEVKTGLSQLQDDLRHTADVGKSTSTRLIDGTRAIELANRSLGHQQQKTGDTGRSTFERLIDSTNKLEGSTTVLGRTYDALLGRIWTLSRQRPGDQLADSVRRAGHEAEKTTTALDKLKTAGRLAAGAFAGAAAAKFIVAEPLNKTMDFGMRLAGMANTAFSDRDKEGRIAGKTELNTSIEKSVREGGGTRDQAASTLDTLIAAGTMSVKDAMALLPSITKSATASGADPTQLANIALRAMATFKIGAKDIPRVFDMATTAGQEGGFELKDMSKWLPQQMAAGRLSGLSGIDGLAKILAANQASVITAGTKDEAGNNLVNLLAKINSQDTAKDAQKLGIDLPGTLAAARTKGIDSLDAFVRLTDMTVGKDKKYQALRKGAAGAKGDDARANFESQADILQGSVIGKLIQDRQALMALVAMMNNSEYVKNVESKTKLANGTTDKNFAVMANEVGFKKQQKEQESEIAAYKGFSALDGPLKSVLDHLIASSREYPTFTAAMSVATTALTALAAAAGAASLASILTKGGAGSVVGAAASGGILSRIMASTGGALTRLLTTGAFAASMPASSFIAGAPLVAAGGVAAAGAAGYGVGSLINKAIEGTALADAIGRSIAIAMAAMGSKEARESIEAERRFASIPLDVKITVENGNIAAEIDRSNQRQSLRN